MKVTIPVSENVCFDVNYTGACSVITLDSDSYHHWNSDGIEALRANIRNMLLAVFRDDLDDSVERFVSEHNKKYNELEQERLRVIMAKEAKKLADAEEAKRRQEQNQKEHREFVAHYGEPFYADGFTVCVKNEEIMVYAKDRTVFLKTIQYKRLDFADAQKKVKKVIKTYMRETAPENECEYQFNRRLTKTISTLFYDIDKYYKVKGMRLGGGCLFTIYEYDDGVETISMQHGYTNAGTITLYRDNKITKHELRSQIIEKLSPISINVAEKCADDFLNTNNELEYYIED